MAYAKSKEDKLKKRNRLIEEAYRQYKKKDFDAIKIADLAKNCQVAKGTVFNYFESKEALFLLLLIKEYGKWYDGLAAKVVDVDALDTGTVQRILLQYVSGTVTTNQTLFRLIGLSHSRLEHNVSLRMAEQYRRFLNERITGLSRIMMEKTANMTMVQSIKLMMSLHSIFVGQVQMATLPDVMLKELPMDELEAYEINFEVTVLEQLKTYMKGLFEI